MIYYLPSATARARARATTARATTAPLSYHNPRRTHAITYPVE
jgi:hypothetical protein